MKKYIEHKINHFKSNDGEIYYSILDKLKIIWLFWWPQINCTLMSPEVPFLLLFS